MLKVATPQGVAQQEEARMVTMHYVEEQLKRLGCNFKFWGRPEIRELANILLPEEIIAGCTNGRYEGGFALLCVTNMRLLLIDRKPMFLTLEDIRFDMIAEIDYSARLLDATVRIITPNRSLIFKSWNQKRLRHILNETQARVMEIRQHFMLQQLQAARSHNQHKTALQAGGLVLEGAGQASLPTNPYTQGPLLLNRRGYPRFY